MDELFFLFGVLVGLSMAGLFRRIELDLRNEVHNGPV